ncbi:MAG: 7-cyano-7-deazaguanine synthase QueC [Candidatus Aureabacteria bacterium]|nr:7-cyano-7-deazaguanine synthase QueC [Candidatus Auribacterota bacterium]
MKPAPKQKINMDKTALAVISGGLDSTVALYLALKKHKVKSAVFFNYGQKAFSLELRSCKKLTKRLGIKLFIIDLTWIRNISKSAITGCIKKTPKINKKDLNKKNITLKTANDVMVYNRNMIFISSAAAIGAENDCRYLITGFNAEEALTFPDNSCKFLDSINETLKASLKPIKIKVISPTIKMTKKDIVRNALKNDFPLDTVYSCYFGKEIMCGVCESCLRLKRALDANNLFNHKYIRFKK